MARERYQRVSLPPQAASVIWYNNTASQCSLQEYLLPKASAATSAIYEELERFRVKRMSNYERIDFNGKKSLTRLTIVTIRVVLMRSLRIFNPAFHCLRMREIPLKTILPLKNSRKCFIILLPKTKCVIVSFVFKGGQKISICTLLETFTSAYGLNMTSISHLNFHLKTMWYRWYLVLVVFRSFVLSCSPYCCVYGFYYTKWRCWFSRIILSIHPWSTLEIE